MSKTFAVADIHGRFDLLEQAIVRIEESSHSGGKVVFLGDYIDRGPDSAKVIARLMVGPDDPSRWSWLCLKGNHEDMMVGCLQSPNDLPWWINNGGGATLASFGGTVPREVRDWCDERPTWHDDGKRVFVHAGVEPKRPMDAQGEAVLLWMRYEPRNADIQMPGRHIIHGHTPERDGPKLYEGRTNLDTYAVGTGRLVVAVFDDDVDGPPVSFLEIREHLP